MKEKYQQLIKLKLKYHHTEQESSETEFEWEEDDTEGPNSRFASELPSRNPEAAKTRNPYFGATVVVGETLNLKIILNKQGF